MLAKTFLLALVAIGFANAALQPTFLTNLFNRARHFISAADASAVQVTVYYESRCSDSAAFIYRQLWPAYERLGDSVLNLTWVPFGKAVSIATKWNRTDYVCQHGVEECLGNNMQAFFLLDNTKSANITNNFIYCQMNLDKTVGDLLHDCADQLGIDWHPIEQCANDQHVYPSYLDGFEKATLALENPVRSVPFVTIDGVQNDSAISSFLPAVCAAYKGNKPAPCTQV